MSFKIRLSEAVYASFALALLLSSPATRTIAQEQKQTKTAEVQGFVTAPGKREFSEALMRQLKAPAGFSVNVFAQPKGNARMMWTGEDGSIYLTRQEEGDVMILRDRDGDGRAEEMRSIATGLELVHGITIFEKKMYLVSPTKVWTANVLDDGTISTPSVIISDLPDGGQHRARQIRVGRDHMLYIGVGSTCNDCDETNKENATILRASLDGKTRTIFAKGLRHTIGFSWHPQTGEMWGMDMGSDWKGNDIPPEELNRLTENGDYGWPYCYADKRPDQITYRDPKGTMKEAYCARTVASTLTTTAHSAPISLVFYTATQFPAEYTNDAFVTLRGSWNRQQPSGYKVVRIKFEQGKPTRIEDFLTGFLLEDGKAYLARIAGLTVARDGSLLISDDSNGVIYRVSYAAGMKR